MVALHLEQSWQEAEAAGEASGFFVGESEHGPIATRSGHEKKNDTTRGSGEQRAAVERENKVRIRFYTSAFYSGYGVYTGADWKVEGHTA